MGLGKVLLKDSERFIIENAFAYCRVIVHKDNVLGLDFCRRNGFKEMELVREEKNMRKELDPTAASAP